MNRSELVRAVAERAGSDEGVARRHVDAVFETVMERVSGGERVTVTGFGTFDRLSRPARSARNPRTGAPVEVAAAEVPRFRSGQTFRTRVAGGAPGAVAEQAEVEAAPAEAAVAPPPSPKKPEAAKTANTGKNAKNGKKAKKVADAAPAKNGKNAKKAPKKTKAIKLDPPPAKNGKSGKSGKDGKKRAGKAKARAKAAK